jgi:transposase
MKQKDENATKIRELVRYDRQSSCRMIADKLDISKETITKILAQDLGMRKSAAKLMPRNLTEEQRKKIVGCKYLIILK